MNNIIHLSLFPNTNCVVCDAEVEEGHLHCLGCCEEFLKMCNEEE